VTFYRCESCLENGALIGELEDEQRGVDRTNAEHALGCDARRKEQCLSAVPEDGVLYEKQQRGEVEDVEMEVEDEQHKPFSVHEKNGGR
jgi:hypothetical protein